MLIYKLKIDFMDLIKIRNWAVTILLLSFIIYLSGLVRAGTLNAKTILDYDPWWYYRHAIEIMNNGMVPPKWDIMSYFPGGRPYDVQLGWSYTMIIIYKILSVFSKGITFLYSAQLSPIIMVGLGAIPAFLLGRLLSNNWGGLAAALFALLAPTFIGVSMAGYTDNDPVVVFYTFLCAYSVLLALIKRSIPYYAFAVVANLLFTFNWGGGWFVLLLFIFFLPVMFVFKAVEEILHQRKIHFDLSKIISEIKPLLIPLITILVATNVLGSLMNRGNIYVSSLIGLTFTGAGSILILSGFILAIAFIGFIAGFAYYGWKGGISGFILGLIIAVIPFLIYGTKSEPLLVNISVAELQNVNILSKDGFLTIGGRIGSAPFLFTIIGLPILIIFKLYKKIKISFVEVFLFLWFLVTFCMILNGIRFSLSFAIAAAVSSGYVIGNFFKYPKFGLFISAAVLLMALLFYGVNMIPAVLVITLVVAVALAKQFDEKVYLCTALGITLILASLFISDAIKTGNQAGGMEVGQNWLDALGWLKSNADKNSLVVTWWDPGHIITGYSGLKVHADGSHCGPGECIPYNHNIRIQDMGRIFSTGNEDEAISILEKYKGLTPDQCNQLKQKYGDIVPSDACNPVTDMYIIASSDLIAKYHWMSYFGDCLNQYGLKDAQSCYNMDASWFKAHAQAKDFYQLPLSNVDQNQGILSYANGLINLVRKGDSWVPVYNNKYVIRYIDYFENGNEKNLSFQNVTDNIDGLAWVDPSMRTLIFMEPAVRDSVFAKMFFWNGAGLNHFQLVFSNSELKVFKVVF
jgi:dolichyl-diphosphooligosaccharide--protein glycosyltransferase